MCSVELCDVTTLFPPQISALPIRPRGTAGREKKHTRFSPRAGHENLHRVARTRPGEPPSFTFRSDLACRNTTLTARRPGRAGTSHPESPTPYATTAGTRSLPRQVPDAGTGCIRQAPMIPNCWMRLRLIKPHATGTCIASQGSSSCVTSILLFGTSTMIAIYPHRVLYARLRSSRTGLG